MLDLFRRHAYSWGTRAVLGVIVAVFAFWGLGTGILGMGRVQPVASVNGQNIMADQLQRQTSRLRQRIRSSYGPSADVILKSINLPQEALSMVIENDLIRDKADRLGLHISDAALEREIESQRAFQNDGRFDFVTYQEVLRANDMLPTEFEDETRQSMIAETLRQMIEGGVDFSEDEVRHAYNLNNQRIGLAYVEFSWSQFTATVAPTPQQIEDYYKARPEKFREPERVRVAFIHYQALALAAKYNPSDKEIEDYYKRNLSKRFTHPDLVHARHILVSVPAGATEQEKAAAKAKAADILKQVQAGGDFKKLAEKYSDDTSNRMQGGDLGLFGRGQMIKPFEDAVFGMKAGDTAMVETRFGYHVVKVDEVKPAHVDTLQEARPRIIEEIRAQTGTKQARELSDQDIVSARGGESLTEIAKKRGLDAVETPALARGDTIPGLPADSKIVSTAFGMEAGQARAISEQDGLYLVRLLEKTPSRIPPLKEIESKVRDAYVRSIAESNARTAAQKMLEQIKTPDDLKRVALESHATVRTIDPFNRSSGQVPGIGKFPEVTDAAGSLPQIPGMIDRIMDQDGNSYVFEVTSRAEPDAAEWNSAKDSFTQEYKNQRRQQAWMKFLEELKSEAKIVIHPEALGRVEESQT